LTDAMQWKVALSLSLCPLFFLFVQVSNPEDRSTSCGVYETFMLIMQMLTSCHPVDCLFYSGRQGSQWDGGDELCCSHGRLCFCLRGGLGLVIVVLCFDQWHDLHIMAMLGLGEYVLLLLIEPVDQYIAARTRI